MSSLSLSEVHISQLPPEHHPLASKFYKASKAPTRIASHDRVFLAKYRGEIIGAFRLTPVDQYWLLRNMLIKPERQKQGVGQTMLTNCAQAFAELDCWCFPYPHLEHFYTLAGFVSYRVETAPEPIQSKYLGYKQRGKHFLLMKYES